MTADEKWMRQALDIALAGWGNTSPNPLVGCIIIKDKKVLAQGAHLKVGGLHAERAAIENAKEAKIDLRDCVLYVNLEPCSHYGRTPPCTDVIIESGIKKVVMAMSDPNPLVCMNGVKRLRKAGIIVKTGVLEKEAGQLNEIFIKYITKKEPFVIMKTAMTLDGKTATKTGDSKWISGNESRRLVHMWRSRVSAILTGSKTVLADDPALTCRLDKEDSNDPIRIIADSRGCIPVDSRVFCNESKSGAIIASTSKLSDSKKKQFEDKGVKVLILDGPDGRVDLKALMIELGNMGIDSVMVEGGATINASCIEDGIVDKVMVFVAPKIIGGRDALGCIGGDGAAFMKEAVLLSDVVYTRCGDDVLIEGYIKR